MKRKMYKSLFILGVLSIFITLSGCSVFGGGKKKSDVGDDSYLSESDLEGRFGSGNIPIAEEGGIFKDVRFDFDSSRISDAGRQAIEYNAQVLQQNPNMLITLEGHCDERGTAEYNLALGAERARTVMDTLLSYGISRNRMNIISYGEEIPLVNESSERAWAMNRRVHFAVRRQ